MDEAKKRLNSQMPIESKKLKSQILIDNSQEKGHLKLKILYETIP